MMSATRVAADTKILSLRCSRQWRQAMEVLWIVEHKLGYRRRDDARIGVVKATSALSHCERLLVVSRSLCMGIFRSVELLQSSAGAR
jgi:hypothetical protein